MYTLCFLGTGTSSGIPVLGCSCATCCSTDPRDQRFRTSAFLTTPQGAKILIDVGPDFRLQGLRHHIHWVDGILITHGHHDHIGGLDELRQLNFIMRRNVAIYGNALALQEIQTRFDYIFKETQKGGGKPQVDLHPIEPDGEFTLHEQRIRPLNVLHGQIPILGYQCDGLAYITDASYLAPATIAQVQGTDVLVINALRHKPHSTHFSLEQTLDIIRQIQPRRAYLVHMTHDIKHAEVERILPERVYLAYDNLEITWGSK